MELGRWAIAKPSLPILGGVCAMVMGVAAFLTLPLEQTPDVQVPVAIVTVPYPGAVPEEVETGLAIPLEERLAGLRDLDQLVIVSHLHGCTAICQFQDGSDPARAKREARDGLEQAQPDFPDEVETGWVSEVSFQDMPILAVSVVGGSSVTDRQRAAEALERILESVPGVNRVEVFGAQARELHVEADPGRLAALGLTLGDVADAVRVRARNIPAGAVDVPGAEYQTRTVAQVAGVADLAATPVRAGGRTLGDVAGVSDTRADVESLARVDGRDAITLILRPDRGINTLEVIAAARTAAVAFGATLPGDMGVRLTGDAGRPIRYMVDQLGSTALYGGMIVVVLLVLAIGPRNAVLVAVAIPFCLLLTFLGFAALGITISGIALFSLILVLGMVVDGAVIVMENIHRLWEQGLDRRTAAAQGIAEVGIPVLAADLTTIAAFLPMILVSGITGQFIAVLPKVVALALLASLAVDHVLLPLLAAWFLPRRRRGAPAVPAAGAARRQAHGGPWLRAAQQRYRRVLAWSLRHPAVVVAGSVAAFVWAVGWIGIGALGYEFFPRVDVGRFAIEVEMPIGTPVEQTDAVTRRLERVIETALPRPPLERLVSTVGNTRALNVDLREGGRTGPEVAKITCELVPEWERNISQAAVIDRLRPRLEAAAGVADVRVSELREGPPSGAPIALRIRGDDLDALVHAAAWVREELRRVPGTRDVRVDLRPVRPQVRVRPDPDRAALFGVTPAGIGAAVAVALHGAEPAELTLGDERVPVRVRAAAGTVAGPEAIGDLRVRSARGALVPVSAVATVEPTAGPESIVRRNRRRTVTVRADLQGGYEAEPVFDAVQAAVAAATADGTWPAGVQIAYGAESDEETESVQSLQRLMGLSLVLILVILTAQFQSFRRSLVVLAAVPLALIGVVAGLWCLAIPIGFLPFVGVVALAGIVVNDAIVLVSCATDLEAAGVPRRQALLDAGVLRLRQVFLTTVTTVGGLLPLAFNLGGGGAFWAPLAWSIISGITFASLLTLIVIPVLLDLTAPRRAVGAQAVAA